MITMNRIFIKIFFSFYNLFMNNYTQENTSNQGIEESNSFSKKIVSKDKKVECHNIYFSYILCLTLAKDHYFKYSECDKYKNYIERNCNNLEKKIN